MNYINTIHEALDIRAIKETSSEVILAMPVNSKTRQPFGYLHGGASFVLAESAASIGTCLNIDLKKQAAVGLEVNGNHLKAKKDGIVTATATPLHRGKSAMVWDVKIEDEDKTLISIIRCTIAIIDSPKRK